MATIKIENLSRKEALDLLKLVQENHAPGFAIQGSKKCRWINTDTVNATVKADDSKGVIDFDNNTFEMYSGYWSETTLRGFINQ